MSKTTKIIISVISVVVIAFLVWAGKLYKNYSDNQKILNDASHGIRDPLIP